MADNNPIMISADEFNAMMEQHRAASISHAIRLGSARPQAPRPSLLQKASNFASSAAAHVAAGMPQASDEERERRFAICQGCEHFDGKACRQCGCPVVREKRFASKLAWADSECPAGKWGKEPAG